MASINELGEAKVTLYNEDGIEVGNFIIHCCKEECEDCIERTCLQTEKFGEESLKLSAYHGDALLEESCDDDCDNCMQRENCEAGNERIENIEAKTIPVVEFDDELFREEDLVTIVTYDNDEYHGKITFIEKDHLVLDCSKQFASDIVEISLDNIEYMEEY